MGIGKRIKQAREMKDMSREQLAARIEVAPSSISNYENDISHPKEQILYRLIDALGVDANFLFQDYMPNLKGKPVTDDELSTVKYDFMEFIRTLDDSQVERIRNLVETALQLGDK